MFVGAAVNILLLSGEERWAAVLLQGGRGANADAILLDGGQGNKIL
jgi:hypothetical protein